MFKKYALVKWFDALKGIGEVYDPVKKTILFVCFPKTKQINDGFWNLEANQKIYYTSNKNGLVLKYFKITGN